MVDYVKTTKKIVGIIALSLVILVGLFLILFFWPFFIAIIIALMLEKAVEYIVKKTKISRKIVGTCLVILFYALIALIIYMGLSKIIKEAFSIATDLPKILDYIKETYQGLYDKYISAMKNIPSALNEKIYELGMDVLGNLSKYITKLFNGTINFIIFIPNIFIYAVITLLATLFLVTDRRKMSMYIHEMLPKKFVRKIKNIFKGTISSLAHYLKAQFIMSGITYVELLVSFIVLKIGYPFTLALVVALIDALPILGVGSVLIPWGIYYAIIGNIKLAIGLLITYAVIIVVRQLIEPRIVSNNIGVHPFITLISMYIGFKIFGIFGLIIGPIVMVVFKNVFSQLLEYGYLKNIIVYKRSNSKS